MSKRAFMSKVTIRGRYGESLRLKNTGDVIFMDKDDWKKASVCQWAMTIEGRVVNDAGIFLEDYLGFPDNVRGKGFGILEFNRRCYVFGGATPPDVIAL